MGTAVFRFYADLNDFLPPARRAVPFTHAFDGRPAVKDVVEALGVPHPEIDLLVADGAPVSFDWPLSDGARIAVYPALSGIDLPDEARLSPPPLAEPRFILDGHLGRLAAYLRLLGLDTAWERDADDADLAARSAAEDRILLTRDVGLLKRGLVSRGRWVRSTKPHEQLAEVLRRFARGVPIEPFRRCLACNALVREVPKEEVAAELPEQTRLHVDRFWRCTGCGKLYWRGAHAGRLEALVAQARHWGAAPHD